ncbi:uncharacterized protein IWZ02DRAFT_189526 [Phyllosticta citriasiana]|uniref:Histidine kinase group protein n=1 Tax=Phyllosticta citriasiana TaxID=595635 RepID=A0ABR1KBP5_9PEZI
MASKKPPHPSNGLSTKSPSTMSSRSSDKSAGPSLTICRNKHWRYISSYHGPWLNLQTDVLSSLANNNYSSPRPRPIDPAAFFDIVKIRRAVDEATDLAVRASTDLTSEALNNLTKNSYNNIWGPNAAAYGLVAPGGPANTKLSKERKFRMREKATQRLSQAYSLDEIAASVATMQSASALEHVANFVLEKKAGDLDAMYVHFFHEKIPSRAVAEHTPLDPLNELVRKRPADGSPLRTRAITKLFSEDYVGAVRDLTEGLPVARHRQKLILARRDGDNYREQAHKEEDQPSSLEAQFLFHRAGAYLRLACQHIHSALDGLLEFETMRQAQKEALSDQESELPSLRPEEQRGHSKRLENRKLVKTNARRALRDYECFLSKLDYSAGQSTSEISGQSPGITAPPTIHPVSSLFSSAPPADLPPFPESSTSSSQYPNELVTYHPLLTDAMHSLLLCHVLLQTSATELRRHALNAARLARISDGSPIFLAARSPARADWIEFLRHAPADRISDLTAESWDALSRPFGHRSWDVTIEDRDDDRPPPPPPSRPSKAMTRADAANRISAHAEREWQSAAGKRANGIVRWVREAPKTVEGGKKKRRTKKPRPQNGTHDGEPTGTGKAIEEGPGCVAAPDCEKLTRLVEGVEGIELAS